MSADSAAMGMRDSHAVVVRPGATPRVFKRVPGSYVLAVPRLDIWHRSERKESESWQIRSDLSFGFGLMCTW